jgi:hypothetical protein
MPPLRSMPEVTLALTQDELNAQFEKFEAGQRSFVQARGNGSTYNLFQPVNADHNTAIFGLMLDGIVIEPVVGEFFQDYETFTQMSRSKPVITYGVEATDARINVVDRKSRTSKFLGKITGRR